MSFPLSRANRVGLTLAVVIGLSLFTALLSAKPGDLVVTPSFVDLGDIPVGQEGPEIDFTMTNNTNQTVDLTNETVSLNEVTINSFGLIGSGPCSIPPGGTCTLPVFMGPSDVGPAALRVRWRVSGIASNWVLITANGVPAS
jgi:hypothetical protein